MPDLPLLAISWPGIAFCMIVAGLLINLSVTLFLHRGMTHGGVTFHPLVAVPMRTIIWACTGMKTKEWVATHRKHHAFSDREGDPHSPLQEGLAAILLGNVFYYRKATRDTAMLEKYGKGTPNDWLERNVYTRLGGFGLLITLALFVLLFGPAKGTVVW
nr:fatty acid desaturase [Gemmatimonadota bacterium]